MGACCCHERSLWERAPNHEDARCHTWTDFQLGEVWRFTPRREAEAWLVFLVEHAYLDVSHLTFLLRIRCAPAVHALYRRCPSELEALFLQHWSERAFFDAWHSVLPVEVWRQWIASVGWANPSFPPSSPPPPYRVEPPLPPPYSPYHDG